MSRPELPGKWIEGLCGDTPAVVAAREVLEPRLRAVEQLLALAAADTVRNIEHVHQLRVATRRASAALRCFGGFCDRRARRTLRERLRSIRAAAAGARVHDVHAAVFAEDAASAVGSLSDACAVLLLHAKRSRAAAQGALDSAAKTRRRMKFAELRRRLLRGLHAPDARKPSVTLDVTATHAQPPYTVSELAGATLPGMLRAVRAVMPDALRDLEVMHGLRLAGKRFRYALEIFAGCFPPEFRDELYPRIERIQERLGAINDAHEIIQRIDNLLSDARGRKRAAAESAALPRIRARYIAERDRLHADFLNWWAGADCRTLFDRLANLIESCCVTQRVHRRQARPEPAAGGVATPLAEPAAQLHRRVAAIDVGTNSIRLVVAESDSAVRFRIIEDVKEATRLGAGVYITGRLDAAAVERTLAALERMRRIAEGYHVERIRAVGTSAVREAANGAEFLELARTRAGVRIETIDAEHEARLAYCSVANAFTLDDRRCGVVDLGGGSTELVIAGEGVIDAIHKLPLGAVRLTDRYVRRGNRGRYRFGEMRRSVDRTISAVVAPPQYPPDLLIGTGGTFTSLARVSILRGAAPGGSGRFPFAVRGYELQRTEIREILGWLRRMPLEERRRVPGLSSQRAEIIVAGICIIERLMRYLRVETLRVHDGGIRDGLLAEMIDELGGAPARPAHFARSAMAAVRSFARRSRYEKDHSEHVAKLALRVFDQLAAALPDASGAWAMRESRDLLHAAAVLHDVGMLVAWKDHNRHSYDMILHAELPLYSRREREIIANIARYHRGRGPSARHANFRRLSDDDQRLVAHLAGILRIADGLDRLHAQDVVDVTVSTEQDLVRFAVRAEQQPRTNLRYGARKADVFEAAFRRPVALTWEPAAVRAE